MKRSLILIAVLLASGCSNNAEAPLPSNVVARINGTDIPADWFMHEFRSTFFRHMQETNVRSAVMNPFMKRMILREQARKQGIMDQPDVQEEIKRKVEGMRAYMEYQLAMAEVGIINQALVATLDISRSPEDVTDEEFKQFFDENIRGKPGAPAAYTALPPQALDSIRQQIVQMNTEEHLNRLIDEWKQEMDIEINESAVQSVPMPEMKNQPPGMPSVPLK